MSFTTIYENRSNASRSKWRLINPLLSIAVVMMLSSCSNILGGGHSVCDLRVLALQIAKQSEYALTGSLEATRALQNSQEKLKQVAPSVIKKISNQKDAEVMHNDVIAMNKDIDIITQNQKNLNLIYDMRIAVSEVIPGIQAEYNLIVDQMARDNYPSTQVVIAKNQVFIAERILRSLSQIVEMGDNSMTYNDDFNADVETLSIYVNAQLEGNADLGVVRINDPELRSSLESIQSDTAEVLVQSALSLRKINNQMGAVSKAVNDIQGKSDAILNRLTVLE